jgi:RNA polymerase sigma-70 factor (ECF subfamily)
VRHVEFMHSEHPSDEELVRRFQSGDESAFEDLVVRWNEPLLQLAYRLTGDLDAARDLRQMALLKTYRRLDTFRGDARLSTWLYSVVLNLSRDRHRSLAADERVKNGVRRELGHNGQRVEPPSDQTLLRDEVVERVSRAVLALPAPEREVVVLRQYHELPFPAIAEVLGAPVTTVKSRMARGLQLLRSRLLELGD